MFERRNYDFLFTVIQHRNIYINLLKNNAYRYFRKETYLSGGETSVSYGCNNIANNFSSVAGSVSSNASVNTKKHISKQN